MKKKFFFSLMTVVALAFVFTSCSKAPEQEMAAATSAIDSAKTAQADLYLMPEFNSLQDSFRVANETMEAEKSKFFLTRNFSDSKAKFENVTLFANQLIEKTGAKKIEIRDSVMSKLEQVKKLLAENTTLLNDAPKGKEGKAALDEIKNDLVVIETSINEVNSMVEAGNFVAANDKITVAYDKAAGINAELKNAISKYKGRNK